MSAILSMTETKAVENGYGARYDLLNPEQATKARKWYSFSLITQPQSA